jgi:hypothetical protein
MPQENEHIRKLIAARDREVEQRRNVADALSQAYERGDAPHQSRRFAALNPDHRSHVVCTQWRGEEGASGRLR